uniref:Uncharacterized protein n=1 Tax=Arundo donax TaxID=35708 RepID=A0A0A8ZEJ8_ARUDO
MEGLQKKLLHWAVTSIHRRTHCSRVHDCGHQCISWTSPKGAWESYKSQITGIGLK